MRSLIREVDANYLRFKASWRDERNRTQTALEDSDEIFKLSYRRITSLQAWRSLLLDSILDEDSLGFFVEGQNDALVSHTLAQVGAWRSALMSLRSCMENVLVCLYYKDHPVELRLWHSGKHRLGFTALIEYMRGHPVLEEIDPAAAGLDLLTKEYGTLSRAVHASAKSFRMSDDASTTRIWSSARASLGSWATREAQVMLAVNLLLTALFRDNLHGARLLGLRKSISLAVPVSRHAAIKAKLQVSLPRP